jgi:hypothetical protein
VDIHKPKPIHGWRGFLSEVAIIVLGVAIALSGEQAVEALHWNHKVEQAERAMRIEIGLDDGPQAVGRAAIAACLEKQLDGLEAAVRAKRSKAEIGKLADAYHPIDVTWDTESWKSATTTQAPSHMSQQDFSRWSTIFMLIPMFERDQITERAALDELRFALPEARPLTAAETEQALRSVRTLRRMNDNLAQKSYFLLKLAGRVGASPPKGLTDEALAGARRRYGACAALTHPKPVSSDGFYSAY